MEFFATTGISGDQFLKLIKDDSEEDSESVVSEVSASDLVQYEQLEWVDIDSAEVQTDEGEELDQDAGSHDVTTLKSQDSSITWLTKPVKNETSQQLCNQAGYPSCNVNPQSVKEVFELFFNHGLKNLILTHTNVSGRALYKDRWKNLCATELDAIIGLCIMAGVFKAKSQDTRELWEESIGIPRFRATVSFNRFQDVLQCMKFDDSTTRDQRRQTDPLAPVFEYLEIFGHACKSNYIPSMELTIGQQLYPWRGRGECIKSSMPKKPGQTGLKFWLATDALNSYCVNITLHSSKSHGNFPEVLNQLCSHLYNQGRSLTIEGLPVNYELASSLLHQDTFILGSACGSQKELPLQLSAKGKGKIGSSSFGFSDDVTICSYVPRRNTSTILMSTRHSNDSPEIIKDYNRTKVGVENLERMMATYSVKRKTKRWPMVVFYNTLDIACYNALVVWLHVNPEWNATKHHKRRSFLKQLALELTEPQIRLRAATQTMHRSTKRAIEDSGFSVVKQVVLEDPLGACKRKRCHICPRSTDRKSQVTCHECNLPVCKEHSNTIVTCRACLQSNVDY